MFETMTHISGVCRIMRVNYRIENIITYIYVGFRRYNNCYAYLCELLYCMIKLGELNMYIFIEIMFTVMPNSHV